MTGLLVLNSSSSPDQVRRKKSYLNSRSREKSKGKRAANVKDSLCKFLQDAQDEDLIFNACSSPPRKQKALSTTIHFTPTSEKTKIQTSSEGLIFTSDHISKSIDVSPVAHGDQISDNSPPREIPFDYRQSVKKSLSSIKPKLKGRTGKKTRQRKTRAQTDNRKGTSESDENDHEDDDDDLDSFAVDDGEDDISLSSNEGTNSRRSVRSGHYNHSIRTSRTSRAPPSRSQSYTTGARYNSLQPAAPHRAHSTRGSNLQRNHSAGNLARGLGELDRLSRRQRMKQEYRNPSARRNGHSDDDCGGSVSSNVSMMSTRSTLSRKPSGLEGGALNAILGDEFMARNASRGMGISSAGTVATAPADEKYLKDRKERQDLIMDIALKEKWQHEARAREKGEMQERQKAGDGDSDCSSDENGIKLGKKKGMIGNLKRAVRKTAKMSKSGAKGTVNVVKDPRQAAKKVGGFAKDVGKETTKMVLDPTLAAKRTAKGVKGTVKLTTKVTGSVAKGSYGVTKTIAKSGIKGTTHFVESTIDGAGKVVHGATGLIFKREGESDEMKFEDYDPKVLAHRQRKNTLVGRFGEVGASVGDLEALQATDVPIRKADILAPSIQLGGGGSWDV